MNDDLIARLERGHDVECGLRTPGYTGTCDCGASLRHEAAAALAQLKRVEAERDAALADLQWLRSAVLEWCDVIDRAGEAFKFDTEDSNAADYFITVSKNAGLARVAIDAALAKGE